MEKKSGNAQSSSDNSHVPITIIVATYNRGAVLSRTLRTVIAQTVPHWRVLVVGDACTDDTASRILALDDSRIQFVNLPARFGEQAGPNSVGIALANTPYVAFLNHDDYWFPEHLALAIDSLEQSGADLYWSRAAFFTNRGAWNDRIFFDDVSPIGRKLEDLYDKEFFVAEPLSSWVARRDALNRLGPFSLASKTALFPIVDYCLRASRIGLTLEAGEAVTVLKDRVWHAPPHYQNAAEYAESFVGMFEARQTDRLIDQIKQDLWLSHSLGLGRPLTDRFVEESQAPRALIDRETGLNLTETQEASRGGKARLLRGTLHQRTGEVITQQPSIDAMVEFARDAIA